ncbi:MAG: hypothetical protein OXG04_09955 [Acidobacteria bacterium]|nr:hypothetical protein [Acidobacteriota bacterium]
MRYEAELLAPVQAHLAAQYPEQQPEAGFYEYRIDLYAHCPTTSRTIAVELKLRNWRRAVEQALLYQLCADQAIIGVPETTAPHVDLEELRTHGLGLLAVRPDGCTEIIAAAESTIVRPAYRAAMIAALGERSR